jgi:hypothetical protein
MIEALLRYVRAVPRPKTDRQKLEAELDAQFPNAQSREIVEYQGKHYRRRFAPRSVSRSRKTVTEWSRWWEQVKDK